MGQKNPDTNILSTYTYYLLTADLNYRYELLFFMENKFYKWWQRHRRVVTFSGLFFLFSLYLSPVIKEAKYKNDCIQNTKKGVLTVWKNDKVEKDIEEKSGLKVEEYAKIEAYRNCNHIK